MDFSSDGADHRQAEERPEAAGTNAFDVGVESAMDAAVPFHAAIVAVAFSVQGTYPPFGGDDGKEDE
jgi:hypothetical protein